MRSVPPAATIALAGLAFAAPLSARAQRGLRIELGSHAQYTWFGNALRLEPTEGFGVHGTLFLLRDLAIESDYTFAPTRGDTRGDIDFKPFYTSGVYHLPLTSGTHLLLGVGYALANYAGDTTKNEWEYGLHLLSGIKQRITASWVARLEALADQYRSPGNSAVGDAHGYWNIGVRAGLSWTYPPRERCVLALTPAALSLQEGQSRQFIAELRTEHTARACPGTVAWSASDDGISASGMYTARAPGEVTVTARTADESATASVTVTMLPPPPKPTPVCTIRSLDLAPADTVILRGERVQLRWSARGMAGDSLTVSPRFTGGTVGAGGVFTAGSDTGIVTLTARAGDGCPEVSSNPIRIHVVPLRSTMVTFDLGRASLDVDAKKALDQVVRALLANPRTQVRIEGHADTIPPAGVNNPASSRQFNARLSLDRADSVTAYLLGAGVDRSRFAPRVRGFSFCDPIVPSQPPGNYPRDSEGRPLGERANRRVMVFELVEESDAAIRWVCTGPPLPLTRPIP